MIEVRNCLRLDSLGGVHHQQGSLAGSDATADLVAEVHMARSVDEIQHIALVLHLYSMALDGDSLFAFKVHVVQHLGLHVPLAQGLGEFQQTVRQGAFTVVDMRYYAEIAYILHFHRMQR